MFTRQILRSSTHFSRQVHSTLQHQKLFHSTPAIMVKVGDAIPNIELREDSPGTKVNLSQELASGKGVIVGVPAAFSPSCSDTHVPGYVLSPRLKNAGKVFVVSVNDAFVMKAWGKTLDEDKSSGVRFIADPEGAFADALDLKFDATAFFGNHRSKRYALLTEDGKITKVSVEDDPSKITVTGADENL